jgi:hypothetical protein
MGGICNMQGERENVYKILVGKSEVKRQPEKPVCRDRG